MIQSKAIGEEDIVLTDEVVVNEPLDTPSQFDFSQNKLRIKKMLGE